MIRAAKKNYKTYNNPSTKASENHIPRLLGMGLASMTLSLFAGDDTDPAFSLMATTISVIAGFTFSALFSSHAIAISDLPPAETLEDKQDRDRLDLLDANHKIRTQYFLFLCIAELAILATLVVDFAIPGILKGWLHTAYSYIQSLTETPRLPDIQKLRLWKNISATSINWLANSIAIFVFAECLYTFYRLADSIIRIIEIRKLYHIRHSENSPSSE